MTPLKIYLVSLKITLYVVFIWTIVLIIHLQVKIWNFFLAKFCSPFIRHKSCNVEEISSPKNVLCRNFEPFHVCIIVSARERGGLGFENFLYSFHISQWKRNNWRFSLFPSNEFWLSVIKINRHCLSQDWIYKELVIN